MIQHLPLDDSNARVLYNALHLENVFPGFNAHAAKKSFLENRLVNINEI